jgi:hypothetical protein
MTLHITNHEAEAIKDACKGMLTKAQAQYRETVIAQIETRQGIRGDRPNHKQNWAPMRSAWPSNFIKPMRKQRQSSPKPILESKQLTAEDILASL